MKNNNTPLTDAKQYNLSVHRLGRWTTLATLIILMLAPIIFCIAAGQAPDWSVVFAPGTITFILGYWAIGIIEAVSYAPLLGTGGQYLSFITGNISNLKLPCAINSQNVAKTEKGSEQEEIITTISIAISSIVTTVIIFIGVLILMTPVGNVVTETLRPVTNYVMPAIFGGLFVALLAMYFKQTMLPFVIMIVVNIIVFAGGIKGVQSISTMIIVGMVVSIAASSLVYNKIKVKDWFYGAFGIGKPSYSVAKKEEQSAEKPVEESAEEPILTEAIENPVEELDAIIDEAKKDAKDLIETVENELTADKTEDGEPKDD